MTTPNKPNVGFWIIAVIALLWNLMGVYQYLALTLMKEEMSEALTEEQLALMTDLPSWYTGVFAIAVFAGALACILLLLRKKWAVSLFLISVLAVIIQMSYWLFATGAMEVYGTVGAVTMPIIVVIVAIFLYFYSKGAAKKGWLR
jgi:hypothetical protein